MYTAQLILPLKIYAPIGKNSDLLVGFGVQPGYLLGGSFRRVYREGEEKVVVKRHFKYGSANYHLNAFDVQLSASVRYGKVELSGRYSLVPIFRAGEGPDVRQASIGILFYFGDPYR